MWKKHNAGQTLDLCYAWRRTEPQYPAGGLVCVWVQGRNRADPGHNCSEPSASFGANPRPGALCLTVPTLSTRPQGRPTGDGRNLAFIPVTVNCEGTVEAISMGFEHSTSSSLLQIMPLSFLAELCMNAHAQKLGSDAGVAQLPHQTMQSSVGSSAKCIATIMQHYLTISWVTPACHKSHAAPSETKLLCVCAGLPIINSSVLCVVCSQLCTCRLLLTEGRGRKHLQARVRLNMSQDDVIFALRHQK